MRLLRRPLLIGRRRDTAALLLTQDARRRLGMVPAAAADAAIAGDRDGVRRSRRRPRVFEIVEQVVELAVPIGVAERCRARLKRRHRRCPRCFQRGRRARAVAGGRVNKRAQEGARRARSLRFLGRRIFGADSLTRRTLHRSSRRLLLLASRVQVCRPHITVTGSLTLSLPDRHERFLGVPLLGVHLLGCFISYGLWRVSETRVTVAVRRRKMKLFQRSRTRFSSRYDLGSESRPTKLEEKVRATGQATDLSSSSSDIN